MRGQWTTICLLFNEVALNRRRWIHKYFGWDAIKELLDALTGRGGVNNIQIEVAGWVGRAAQNGAGGDNTMRREVPEDEANGFV